MRHLAENLLRAKRKRVEGAGHLAPITHASTVNAPIAEFIAHVDTCGGERCGGTIAEPFQRNQGERDLSPVNGPARYSTCSNGTL